MTDVQKVKAYWEEHPLHGYEVQSQNSPQFFEYVDAIKRNDIERFSGPFWNFKGFPGQRLLDVGCGPGWFTVQYAAGGAQVTAIDLTARAVETARCHLAYRNLTAAVSEANAEALPFPDASFDVVISAGVLHHTPQVEKAISECFRVLKPGGVSKIALYHKGILHNPAIFPFVKLMMRSLQVKHPGADLSKTAATVDEFIRQYDGEGNPVGIGKTTREWSKILRSAGFKIIHHELHYFPKRFIGKWPLMPGLLHFLCDKFFGTLICFELRKTAPR